MPAPESELRPPERRSAESEPRVSRRSRLLVLFSVLGPGLIAAAAGNEAGGIFTYSRIGAAHGFTMLWLLFLSTFSLFVAQEMGTRMGIVTGKGLADLIREEFGVRIAVFAMAILFVANVATTVSEFIGITEAVQLLVPPPWSAWVRFTVPPLVAALLWLLVMFGSYRRVERVFLGMCSVYLAYAVAAFLAHPDWGEALRQTVTPQFPRGNRTFAGDAIGLVGTTIAPWMQFYIQSSVRDKGLRPEHYRIERLDVLLGTTLSNLISFFIVVACAATLWASGHRQIGSAADAARALEPVMGSGALAKLLFAVGLFNASAVGAVIVPLSTAYAVSEAIGSESGLGRKLKEAPLFIWVFTALLAISTLVVVVADSGRLMDLVNGAQRLNGILLPVILVLMLRIVNTRRLMGAYVNRAGFNLVAWATVGTVIALSLASLLVG